MAPRSVAMTPSTFAPIASGALGCVAGAGLATGLVDELYHPGYVAKHLEMGAVVAGAPAANVRREVPTATTAPISRCLAT